MIKKLPIRNLVLEAWHTKTGDAQAIPNQEIESKYERSYYQNLYEQLPAGAESELDLITYSREMGLGDSDCCGKPDSCTSNDACRYRSVWNTAQIEKAERLEIQGQIGLEFKSVHQARKALENIQLGRPVSLGVQKEFEDTAQDDDDEELTQDFIPDRREAGDRQQPVELREREKPVSALDAWDRPRDSTETLIDYHRRIFLGQSLKLKPEFEMKNSDFEDVHIQNNRKELDYIERRLGLSFPSIIDARKANREFDADKYRKPWQKERYQWNIPDRKDRSLSRGRERGFGMDR